MTACEQACQLDSPAGPLDAIWMAPADAVANLVFAHGAGAGIGHATMQGLALAFADVGLASLRFNFPFMQAGKRRVDGKAVSVQAIASAADYVRKRSERPLFLAGHSFGGRMSSHAVTASVVNEDILSQQVDCTGLIYCSFPLHSPKKPDTSRAAHLPQISQPMLFLSGTRDDLADASLLQGIVDELPQAQIHWLETANHSYTILKRTRTNPMPVFEEMAQQARGFVDELI